VHPVDGVDPDSADKEALYINDPSLKFKTLQAGIDAMQRHLANEYDAVTNPNEQGIVYALPGLYGPFGPGVSSDDQLPIRMRDRVHVQGAGARQCVIRGASTIGQAVTNTATVLLPTRPSISTAPREVLVTYGLAHPGTYLPTIDGSPPTTPAPWLIYPPALDADNAAEVFDSFSLLGGDVQVSLEQIGTFLAPEWGPACRISNCVFDLRHDWKHIVPPLTESSPSGTNIAGPYVGIHIPRRATCYSGDPGAQYVGYLDGRTLIAHNTFVFAHWNNIPGQGWESWSRDEAVGILDFNNPACATTPCTDPNATTASGVIDYRGIGNPCIVGNVFRTRPLVAGALVQPFAMLGIEARDTLVSNGTSFVQTNLFDPGRVGSTNNVGNPTSTSASGFFSRPVLSTLVESVATNGRADLWNCATVGWAACSLSTGPCLTTSPAPSPAAGLALWNGTSGVDPAFVGEYVSTVLGASTLALRSYRDWRVMPGSPVENRAIVPPGNAYVTPAGSFSFATNEPPELDLFKWDGERWGNPRVVDGAPDVGFDERHLVIEAGNWASDTNSHNVPGFMTPFGVGQSTRYFILPRQTPTVIVNTANRWLQLFQTSVDPPDPSSGDGWIAPPGALLTPPSLAALPASYRTKYVSFATASTAPISLAGAFVSWSPFGNPAVGTSEFVLRSWVDDECSGSPCKHSYFNLQGVIYDNPDPNGLGTGTELLRANMQGEYR